MAVKATDIHRDMEVFDCDGSRIGLVFEVYGSEHGGSRQGEAPPTGVSPTGKRLPFLRVVHEASLHQPERIFALPAEAVREVTNDGRVVLTSTGDECERLYRENP